MDINFKNISIRELVKNYIDDNENGVFGYGGLLNIRPPYQREFIYNDKQKIAVIDTVLKQFPLNIMYWSVNNDGTYEIIDGQQRTVSICKFVNKEFSYNNLYFHNLTEEEQKLILDYKIAVYFCEGSEREKLEWFKTINIAGEKLKEQELRNAVYHGVWVTDAKRYFSKTNCVAYNIGKDYMDGKPIRQDYLESVLKWISNENIEEYMGNIQKTETEASSLFKYFKDVINWVESNFIKKRKEMKGIEWGYLYNKYKDISVSPVFIEEKIKTMMMDDEVTNKKGIYEFLLSGDEKFLNLRKFSEAQKRETYERQKGICSKCGEHFEYEEMEGDHITPWSQGGKTDSNNCQMLCIEDNRRKSSK